jgi:hypothetical protein
MQKGLAEYSGSFARNQQIWFMLGAVVRTTKVVKIERCYRSDGKGINREESQIL